MRGRLSSFYFAAQGLAVLAWWILLFQRPALRTRFLPTEWPDGVLFAFLLPDLVFVVGGSWLLAWLILRQSVRRAAVGWGVVGAVGYATFYCVAAMIVDLGTWVGAVAMFLALSASAFFVSDP